MRFSRPLALFDIESTGLDTQHDEIIEIAVVRIEMDGTRTSRVRRVRPSKPIPPEVTAIHGITDAMVENEPTFKDLAPGLFKLLDGCDVSGFNVLAFDIPMLHEEFSRAGIYWVPDLTRVIDVGVLFKVMERRTLEAAVSMYCNREHEGAHGALPDTIATADVLEAMILRYPRFQTITRDTEIDETSTVKRIEPNEQDLFAASCYDGPPPVDVGGKLSRDADGDLVYAFGKNKGIKVKDDLGYARWMLRSDFPSHTCALLRDEMDRA